MEARVRIFEHIWLADDDHDDCELFADVLKQILPTVTLTIIPNGEELINRLYRQKSPDLLFIDINMPCKDGLDCLLEIRANRKWSRLPVIVFSSSKEARFIDASYGYGANLYYKKPTGFQELIAGLGNLLRMNWDDPYSITNDHYVDNKFIPFSAPHPD